MVFIACGLNHKTAPLYVREKIALSSARQEELLKRLNALPSITEAVLLSTCNRTELYCMTTKPDVAATWLAIEQGLSELDFRPHFYTYESDQGIRHLLRVASGLDSMMLGEPQIFGQMKQAYQNACQAGAIGEHLRQLFPCIFSASKRIRRHSGIGNNPISIASAAVQLIGRQFKDYTKLNVFIIGSGETSSLVAKYLHQEGARQFMVASRNLKHANTLAIAFQGKALAITDIPHYLPQADVVISATTCPLPFITKASVEQALLQRDHRPMFLLDLAVPRDIESEVSELHSASLFNIDDLHALTQKGLQERQLAAVKAEQMVDTELQNYQQLHRSRLATEMICDYRSRMQTLAQQELQRAQQKLSDGHCQYTVLTEFSERLINKLMHTPSIGLKQAAIDERADLFDLLHYLLQPNIPSLSWKNHLKPSFSKCWNVITKLNAYCRMFLSLQIKTSLKCFQKNILSLNPSPDAMSNFNRYGPAFLLWKKCWQSPTKN